MFGRGAGRDGGLGAGAGCCFWGRRFAAGAILASAATAPNAAMLISATAIHPNWNRLIISLYNRHSATHQRGSFPYHLRGVTA